MMMLWNRKAHAVCWSYFRTPEEHLNHNRLEISSKPDTVAQLVERWMQITPDDAIILPQIIQSK